MAVKERIKTLLDQLNTGIYEKKEIMALALLSSIAGESIFLLGPPGVAKSLIARRLKYAYKDASVFEYLMSRFSTPDEIFGPVSISELKKDKYVRIIDNYLPTASVVFLDEIWKAGPSIQNALLTILNEKKFRNGEKEIDVPMKALISASNELPAKDQGLEALWDRFLVRLIVNGIEDQEKFRKMIGMPSLSGKEEDEKLKEIITETISDEEYKEWSKKINQIAIPENVFNVIHVIRGKIEQYNKENKESTEKQIYVSDRRWRKIVRLMCTSAFLNDRTEVDLMDCFLIKHCIWNEKEQTQTVSGFVNDAIRDYGPELDMRLHTERKLFEELTKEIEKNTSKKVGITPVVEQDTKGTKYYRLATDFEEKYLLIGCDTIDKLVGDTLSTTIYSNNYSENRDCEIIKSDEKNSVKIRNRRYDDYQIYQLKTEPVIKPFKKSPSRGDYQIWNEETEKLLYALNEKKAGAIQYWSTFSESFYGNLFVNLDDANEHIKSKIDTVINDVEKLMIDINEIRNKYQSIYKPNEQ
ncbi:MAG: AAA family ATPase [Treponema sp.]|jgi:MoxR-like ATPase|nr:AAA family ATPase [Treponema sp.]